MSSVFTLHHRFTVEPRTLDSIKLACESSEDYFLLGSKRKQRLRRHFLRGVPGKQIDLALVDEYDPSYPLACEIGRKEGRYGGERWHISLRHWFSPGIQPLPAGWLIVSPEEDERHACLAAGWTGGSWIERFERLRTELSDYDPAAIPGWHWRHYYRVPLPGERCPPDIVAAFILELPPTAGLAEANRRASRLLYRAARDAGWRKLTSREQERYGLTGQWHREMEVLRHATDLGYTWDGVGQYTVEAANGREMHETDEAGYIQTAHGLVEIE